MSFVDELCRWEFFAFPVWKKAEKAIASRNVELFRQRWPSWSRRLAYFPEITNSLFSEIFFGKNKKIFDEKTFQMLEMFFQHATVDPNSKDFALVLSGLCLEHNWEALNAIRHHVPFTPQTNTIIACAMVQEITSNEWETRLNRPLISSEDVLNFFHTHEILPVLPVQDVWIASQMTDEKFSSAVNGMLSSFGMGAHVLFGGASCLSLPNFSAKTLWEAVVLQVQDVRLLQCIIEKYEVGNDDFTHVFDRRSPLTVELAYRIIKDHSNIRVWESLQTHWGCQNIEVTENNFVSILEKTSPAVAPDFKEAWEQICNEKQRELLRQSVHVSAPTSSRRKM